jgi:protein-tyrosine kinase
MNSKTESTRPKIYRADMKETIAETATVVKRPTPGLLNPSNHKIEIAPDSPAQLDKLTISAAMAPRLLLSKAFEAESIDVLAGEENIEEDSIKLNGHSERPDIREAVEALRSAEPTSTLSEILAAGLEKETTKAVDTDADSSFIEIDEPVDFEDSIEETAQNIAETQESIGKTFRPMLQVDSFAWPTLCERISPTAKGRLDQLSERLDQKNSGQIIGIVGSTHKAGSTTLLLSMAQSLAESGKRVLLMDAHFNQPELADRLGLEPENGWELVNEANESVAELLIESINDRLTLLPLCKASPLGPFGLTGAPSKSFLKATEELREHFDLILVDLGAAVESEEENLMAAIELVDTAIIVHNVRDARRTDLIESRTRIRDFGIKIEGIIENFASLDQEEAGYQDWAA